MIERVQKIYPSTLELVDKINEIVYNVNVLQMHEERCLDLLTELICRIQQARKNPQTHTQNSASGLGSCVNSTGNIMAY